MIVLIRRVMMGLGLLVLAACSAQVGPDPDLLIGTWVQNEAAQTDPGLTVDDAVITYAPDGTSTFNGIMTVTENEGIPERFTIAADVAWTLDETVITRTLTAVTITPDISTPEADALAQALEAAYLGSPPGQLIIETVDETQLILLDAATGATLTYRRET